MDPISAEDRLRVIAAQLSALNFSIKRKDIFCISIEIQDKARRRIKKFTIDDLPESQDGEKSILLKFITHYAVELLQRECREINKGLVQ